MTFRNGPQRSPHMALALLFPWIARRLPHHCQNYWIDRRVAFSPSCRVDM
jgi:hypothetical protein